VTAIQDLIEADPAVEITVDLVGRQVRVGPASAESPLLTAPLEIDDYTRWRLMEGHDDIGLTLRHAGEILSYEERRPTWMPVAG
jgi:3-isopropylmalate/(R)-2-methylmalate dehydratase small subunit